MKPGYKTTEFWLSTIAVLTGAVMASGVFHDGSVGLKVVGIVASILGALGYGKFRTVQKANEAATIRTEVPKVQ